MNIVININRRRNLEQGDKREEEPCFHREGINLHLKLRIGIYVRYMEDCECFSTIQNFCSFEYSSFFNPKFFSLKPTPHPPFNRFTLSPA